jgi:hypothetical protein
VAADGEVERDGGVGVAAGRVGRDEHREAWATAVATRDEASDVESGVTA